MSLKYIQPITLIMIFYVVNLILTYAINK